MSQRTHSAVKLRSKQPAMEVSCARKRADDPVRLRVPLWVASCAIAIDGGRHRGRRIDQVAPENGHPIGYGGHVLFCGLGAGVDVVVGLAAVAALIVLVLICE